MRKGTLLLLAPGLLGPVPRGGAAALGESLPATERLLARARRRHEPAAGWLGDLTGGVVMASGPVALLGADGEPGTDYWLRADPVHLRPDRDRLLLFGGAALCPQPAESEALIAAFNGLFRDDGLKLLARGGHWFLRAETPPPVELPPTAHVAGRYLDEHLPDGESGRELRAFLNEAQMLFHGNPVNAEREARGEPTINGLWIWGGGRLPPVRPSVQAAVYADDPFLRGAARLAGIEPSPAVARLSQIPASDLPAIAEWPLAEAALTAGDLSAWLTALTDFEQAWARELASALNNRTIAEATVTVGRHGFVARRAHLRRFWRRLRPLRHWLDTT